LKDKMHGVPPMRLCAESILWRFLKRYKSYVVMQAAFLRESEILAFTENEEAAKNLVDHLQNWIDGIIPIMKLEGLDFYKTRLGMYLTEFGPTLQFAVICILGGAYFDAIRNLRFSLESVLDGFRDSARQRDLVSSCGDQSSYYSMIESLPMFSQEEKKEIKALYGKLSELSHPSLAHLKKLLEEPSRAFVFAYDPDLFVECCSFTDEVAGVIFSVVLETWPHIRQKARSEIFFYQSLKRLPFTSERI